LLLPTYALVKETVDTDWACFRSPVSRTVWPEVHSIPVPLLQEAEQDQKPPDLELNCPSILSLHTTLLLSLPSTQMVAMLRLRPEVAARGRERAHLLLLYPLLCEGITCKDQRVREMVKDVLQLAGAELGLGGGFASAAGAEPGGGVSTSGGA
jgi:hypothetical protein